MARKKTGVQVVSDPEVVKLLPPSTDIETNNKIIAKIAENLTNTTFAKKPEPVLLENG